MSTSTSTTATATTSAELVEPSEVVVVRHISPFLPQDSSDKNEESWDVSKTAFVVLNAPIRKPPSAVFSHLWHRASFHVCADGGANRLYQATVGGGGTGDKLEEEYVPDLITGDLDSLKSHVRSHYETKKNVSVVRHYNQDANDLAKSLLAVAAHQEKKFTTCIIYGAFGGRFDQEMGCLQALFEHQSLIQRLWLYNDQNAALLLQPGCKHTLAFPNFSSSEEDNNNNNKEGSVLGEGPTCGLIPLGMPCQSITTKGLQWNLNGQKSEFGGLVSTSNRIVAPEVEVECSHPLLFSVEIQHSDGHESW